MTDVTLSASAVWPGTRTGAGGTDTLASRFFDRITWLHGHQDFIYLDLESNR